MSYSDGPDGGGGIGGEAGEAGEAAEAGETGDMEVRFVHPFQARKEYLCPGCQQVIYPGTGHVVVVPRRDPGARRHWHRPCWEHRSRRRPGRP